MRLSASILSLLLHICFAVPENSLQVAVSDSEKAAVLTTDSKGNKSPADPQSCSKDAEIFGFIEKRDRKLYIAGAAFTYGIPPLAHELCALLSEQLHNGANGHRFPTERQCARVANIVRSGIITIFGIVQAVQYTFHEGKIVVNRVADRQNGLAHVLEEAFAASGYKYHSIKVISPGLIKRFEAFNNLQELVLVESLIAGNDSFDLSYRQFTGGNGSITIVPTSFGVTKYGPLEREALGHSGHGIQIHYTTRHWSPEQSQDDRVKLSNSIAHYWAEQTARHNKAALIGFVETAAPKGKELHEYKGRRIRREANFYYKVVVITDGNFRKGYELVDSPCGELKDFLDLKLPSRDKEL
jgi:hypothetical protein